jgi:hypothetical protein
MTIKASFKRLALVCGELHGKAAAFEDLLVERLNGICGLFNRLKVNVTKAMNARRRLAKESFKNADESGTRSYPLLNPRVSRISLHFRIGPNRDSSLIKSFSVTSKKRLPI